MYKYPKIRGLIAGVAGLLMALAPIAALAQPANDECLSATFIPDARDYCSEDGAFTIEGATESPQVLPSCWPSSTTDVWFAFFAAAPGLVIQVNGADGSGSGTLQQPSVILLRGDCQTGFTEVVCGSDGASNQNIERVVTNLVTGALYYLRVDARNGNVGTFQLCLKSFLPTNEPSADCPTAAILCDKSPFSVEELRGTGDIMDEADDSCLDTDPFTGVDDGNSERSSVWYTWTCDVAGFLTFTLTPNSSNVTEDLDFAVYELPNGINDCAGKILLRCMASGENVGEPISAWESCIGPTGLRVGETDFTEERGCSPGDNNFLAPIDMEPGVSYALVVNNFSQSGRGFEIEWGGSGTFLGPVADFEIEAVDAFECDKTIIYSDLSDSQTDSIVSWEWQFGAGANPETLTGRGPHDVVYASFGEKRTALVVETSRGCKITKILDIFVEPCCADTSTLAVDALVEDLICEGVPTGQIEALGENGRPIYLYSLDGAGFQPSPVYANLDAGTYSLEILDQAGCTSEVDVEVLDAPPYIIDAGDTVFAELGQFVQLNAVLTPNSYSSLVWSPMDSMIFTNGDSLRPLVLPPGTTQYQVQAINEAGCVTTDDVLVVVEIVRPVYAPNVFSPNGDGINDVFFLSGGPAVERIETLRVFDRWGGIVFEKSDGMIGDEGFGWDGRVNGEFVNPGVFAFHARIRFVDNISLDYSGSITVLR